MNWHKVALVIAAFHLFLMTFYSDTPADELRHTLWAVFWLYMSYVHGKNSKEEQ